MVRSRARGFGTAAPAVAVVALLLSGTADAAPSSARSTVATQAAAAPTPDCRASDGSAAQCPTIIGHTIATDLVRRAGSPTVLTYSVDVRVSDPAGLVAEVEDQFGRGLDRAPSEWLVVGYGQSRAPLSTVDSVKTYRLTVRSPERPLQPMTAPPAYGDFYDNVVLWGRTPGSAGTADPDAFLGEIYVRGRIRAASVVTNVPSSAAVPRGGSFSLRGALRRFDGVGAPGQKVVVSFVPAGQTRSSYAGTATTGTDGAWSLPVRAWSTGSWFATYGGSPFMTPTYKAVWVRAA